MDYEITVLAIVNNFLGLKLNKAIPANLRAALTLNAEGAPFRLADATLSDDRRTASWGNPGLSWSVGGTVQLSLTEGSSSTTRDEPQQIFPDLDRLPRHPSVEPFPARLRIPEGGSASDAYCYIGEGNDKTEYVRYPDGRIAETTRQSDATRTAYACD